MSVRIGRMAGRGPSELARAVRGTYAEVATAQFRTLYDDDMSLWEKTRTIARSVYGADDIDADQKIRDQFAQYERAGYGHFPICMAKTQYSFSTDPRRMGAPGNHRVKVRELALAAGAEFLVVVCGDIMRMPGLAAGAGRQLQYFIQRAGPDRGPVLNPGQHGCSHGLWVGRDSGTMSGVDTRRTSTPAEFTTRASSINRALDQIGDKWCLLIIQEVLWGINSFNDMMDAMGVSRGVLSNRLTWLQEVGCLRKDVSRGRLRATALSPHPEIYRPV